MLHKNVNLEDTSSRAHQSEQTLRAEKLGLEKWCQNTAAGSCQVGLSKKNYE